jgi:hypothetical protein
MRAEKIISMGQLTFYGTALFFGALHHADNLMKIKD